MKYVVSPNFALSILLISISSITHSVESKQHDFDVSGYIMVDANQTGPFYDKQDTDQQTTEIRRARLAVKYDPPYSIKTKLQFQYSTKLSEKDDTELDDYLSDAYIQYGFENGLKLRLGKMKQVANYERLSSSRQLTTIERSMVSQTFFDGRDYGVRLYKNKKRSGWDLGYFQNEDSQSSIQGRFYDKVSLGFGKHLLSVNGQLQDLNDQLFQLKNRAEVNTADNTVRSARFYAKQSQTLQIELLGMNNQWRWYASYGAKNIEQVDGRKWRYQGGFAQISYSHQQDYQFGKGKLKSIDYGWEVLARISALDLTADVNDGGDLISTGNQASSILLGFNYYQTKHLKYMLNALLPSISGQVNSNDQSGYALTGRVQYSF